MIKRISATVLKHGETVVIGDHAGGTNEGNIESSSEPLMYHFIMPQDALEPRRIDKEFLSQAEHLRQQGHTASAFPEAISRGGDAICGIPKEAKVVYRGWMVTIEEYRRLEDMIRSVGARLLTDTAAYALTHHLPNWYPALAEWTAQTVVITDPADLVPTMDRLGWGGYFLKDFVKSLKVEGGSVVRTEKEANHWLSKMREFRPEIEGGVCLRQVESFEPETECRFFVVHGVGHSPDGRPIPEPVTAAAKRIASPFFSVDTAMTTSGHCRIVELGDGQVSDLVGWSAERFSQIWPP